MKERSIRSCCLDLIAPSRKNKTRSIGVFHAFMGGDGVHGIGFTVDVRHKFVGQESACQNVDQVLPVQPRYAFFKIAIPSAHSLQQSTRKSTARPTARLASPIVCLVI